MAIQLSTAVRDARANAIETTIGTAPILRIYDLTGAAPANCAASISGIATLLAEMTLPSDWLGASSSGAKAIANGPWSDASANGTGTADFFRIWDAAGTTCHMQGTVGQGTGDLQVACLGVVRRRGRQKFRRSSDEPRQSSSVRRSPPRLRAGKKHSTRTLFSEGSPVL